MTSGIRYPSGMQLLNSLNLSYRRNTNVRTQAVWDLVPGIWDCASSSASPFRISCSQNRRFAGSASYIIPSHTYPRSGWNSFCQTESPGDTDLQFSVQYSCQAMDHQNLDSWYNNGYFFVGFLCQIKYRHFPLPKSETLIKVGAITPPNHELVMFAFRNPKRLFLGWNGPVEISKRMEISKKQLQPSQWVL